ncbi:glycosyltransferase family 4 protein [Enterobacter sp. 22146]|uniref:glycosyltransferase family 4 protein n=1 Tax=Enterobacter TaxID=547 RepID=UPI000EAD379A|nr:glycosyltransferase family 4 protein [Enterobacter ludwigii]MCE2009747.1 glycosyltransferase family 4 protein [Enterobacter ludwigii]
MKVLILTDELYPYHIGGAGVVASQTAQTLIGRNIPCTIMCSNPKKTLLRKLYNILWPFWGAFTFIFSLIKNDNDVILVNDLRSAYILGVIGTKKILNKVVYIVHGTEIDIVYKKRSKKNSLILISFFYSRFLSRCKKVIFVSQYVASRTQNELGQQGIKLKKEVVSYAGLNADMLDFAMQIPVLNTKDVSTIRLVSFSRLERRKGYLTMMTIFEAMLERGADLIWDIYGTGRLESDIVKEIKDKGLEKRIRIKGMIDRGSITSHINPTNYDAYWLLPIEPEAFGLTFIESAAIGLPAIGPMKYGITEAIGNNVSGFFYEDPEKLVSDLEKIKANKEYYMITCKNWALKFKASNFIDDILN